MRKFNLISNQRNANQHNKIPFFAFQIGTRSKIVLNDGLGTSAGGNAKMVTAGEQVRNRYQKISKC